MAPPTFTNVGGINVPLPPSSPPPSPTFTDAGGTSRNILEPKNTVGNVSDTLLNAFTGRGPNDLRMLFEGDGIFGGERGNPFSHFSQMFSGAMGGMQPGRNTGLGGIGGVFDAPDIMGDVLARSTHGMNQFDPNRGNFDKWFGIDPSGGMGDVATNLASRAIDDPFGYRGSNPGDNKMMEGLGFLSAHQNQKDPTRFNPMALAEQGKSLGSEFDIGADVSKFYDQGSALKALGGDHGRRATEAVSAMQNEQTNQLMRDIDTESQRTLGMELPEVQAAMESAGVGRSGAAGFAGGELATDILGQANRDKQRILHQTAESSMARNADTINRGAALGAQSDDQRMNQLMGLTNTQMNLAGQGGLQNMSSSLNLLGQGHQSMVGQNMADLDRYNQNMLAGEDLRLKGIGMGIDANNQGIDQMMRMFGMREGLSQGREDRAMQEALALRDIDMQQWGGQFGLSQMPMNLMMQMATGIGTSGYNPGTSGGGGNSFLNSLVSQGGPALINAALGGSMSGVSGNYNQIPIY